MNGYSQIAAPGLDLLTDTSSGTVKYDGLFAAAKEAIGTGKPIYITGLEEDSKPCTPIQAYAIDGTSIVLIISHYSLTVTSADVITLADLIPEVTPPTKAKK